MANDTFRIYLDEQGHVIELQDPFGNPLPFSERDADELGYFPL